MAINKNPKRGEITREHLEKLKDPRYIIALQAVKHIRKAKNQATK